MLTTIAPLRAERNGLLQERVRLGERRRGSESLEDLADSSKDVCGLGRFGASEETAALGEERESLLGDAPDARECVVVACIGW